MMASMTTKRHMSYEEFVAGLPGVLDDLAREDETVLIEKNGRDVQREHGGSRQATLASRRCLRWRCGAESWQRLLADSTRQTVSSSSKSSGDA